MWLKLRGTLRYEPYRADFRKTHKQKTLIVELKRDGMCDYYGWFLKRRYGEGYVLQSPMFGKHVTIVRGDEKLKHPEHWKKYEGRKIEIEYDPERVVKTWAFWSIDVRPSLDLLLIRQELGLKATHSFHITIGREYPHQHGFAS